MEATFEMVYFIKRFLVRKATASSNAFGMNGYELLLFRDAPNVVQSQKLLWSWRRREAYVAVGCSIIAKGWAGEDPSALAAT